MLVRIILKHKSIRHLKVTIRIPTTGIDNWCQLSSVFQALSKGSQLHSDHNTLSLLHISLFEQAWRKSKLTRGKGHHLKFNSLYTQDIHTVRARCRMIDKCMESHSRRESNNEQIRWLQPTGLRRRKGFWRQEILQTRADQVLSTLSKVSDTLKLVQALM